jgi:hypothetical protein
MIDIGRIFLATRRRETDPLTYANPAEVTLVRLERGIDVALYGMQPTRRLPVESFFGYVAARNRVPMAYGGGWVFLDRAEIGINVLDPFRGGESAYLFAQVLRVYHQHYGARQFRVDPYQFGQRNAEAIRSGAYWFYDRLGFRSSDAGVAELAEQERSRIARDRRYRSPFPALRRLASAPLVLDLGGDTEAAPDLVQVSLGVTAFVAERFDGDQERADRWALRRLGRAAPRRLRLLAAIVDELQRMSPAQRPALLAVIAAKSGPRERDYVRRMQEHGGLRAGLQRLGATVHGASPWAVG